MKEDESSSLSWVKWLFNFIYAHLSLIGKALVLKTSSSRS